VHGDTFSTLLGALAARLSGLKVAHIESGLRSFNLFHPFPEEATRLAIFRLTDIAFCPNAWAISNLSKYQMEKVDCGGNTLLDAVNYAMARPLHEDARCKHDEYGVVSLHRFENIFNRAQLTTILSLVEEAAKRHPLVFVLHPATRKKLIEFQLLERLSSNPRLLIRNRMTYVPFLQLLSRAQFAITDGGSNQEELSYLGIPTLLMRKATERIEGLDQNVTISSYDLQILRAFLAHLEPTNPLPIQGMNISGRIVDKLSGYGERKTK
jgi:UDP-N-acetylglucosamine 2-epimerase (non-hydrolysing)